MATDGAGPPAPPPILSAKPIHPESKSSWSAITVEPMLALYIIPLVITILVTQNLSLDRACRVNLAYGTATCDALMRQEAGTGVNNASTEESNVQKLVATTTGWKTILHDGLPCMLILFWGSWSDRHGRRKPCMLWPIVGQLITSIGLMLCTYFESTSLETTAIVETLVAGLTGGWFVMLMGAFSYMADITTTEERTLRIGILNLCLTIGITMGLALSGVLLKACGFYGAYGITAAMLLASLIYGIYYVQEPTRDVDIGQQKAPERQRAMLLDFFDKAHISETFRVVFKTGDAGQRRRLRVILLIVAAMIVNGPMHGELAVVYLFTRFKFGWSGTEYSVFSTYSMVVSLIGTICSVSVFSQMLQMEDSLIGVISCLSKILSSFVYAFAQTDWQFYIAPVAEILYGPASIAVRSIASKMVCSNDLGKLNSLFGVAEALVPLIYAPLYATVYAATLNVLPGAFFLVGGALTVPAVVILAWMYNVDKRALSTEQCKGPNTMGEMVMSENEKRNRPASGLQHDNFAFVSNDRF